MQRGSTGFLRYGAMHMVLISAFVVVAAFTALVNAPPVFANPPFAGDVVVFYPEHPDDEVLWGGSAIRSAVDANGADNVYVVLVTRGLSASPFTRTAEYAALTGDQKGQLRENEFRAAMKALGVESANIIVLPDQPPGANHSLDLMRESALRLERSAESEGKAVTHVAHSFKYDDNAEHRANGRVIKGLLDEGQIHDALFWIKPQYRFRVPPDDVVKFQALTPEDLAAVHAAIDAYERSDARLGLEAVGFRATPWYFALLGLDKRLTAVLHTADVPG